MSIKIKLIKLILAICISAATSFSISNDKPDMPVTNKPAQQQQSSTLKNKEQKEKEKDLESSNPNGAPNASKTNPLKPPATSSKPKTSSNNKNTESSKPAPNTSKPNTTPNKPTPNTSKPATTPNKPATSSSKPATNQPKPTEQAGFSQYQNKVLELVNIERAKVGLNPLKISKELSNVATIKSQDMINNNYFAHNSPKYGSPFDMMKQFGIKYRAAGENIAYGQKTPEAVMNSWMNSEGHRKNILNPSFRQIGIGIATNSNVIIYWTQQFIG